MHGATVANSLDTALELAAGYGGRVYCAGGAQIYAQALPRADRMFLSFIKGEFEGDAFFPEFDEAEWNVTERVDHPAFEFVAYTRA